MPARPYRSALYIPGAKARALEKARTLPVDAILFDLEDAVAPAEKEAARGTLRAALEEGGYGDRARIVRINALDTPWGADDLSEIANENPDGILLPKVGSANDIETLAKKMDALPGYDDTRIWAMIETPIGVLHAPAIARSRRMAGFVMGTNDLAKDLHATGRAALTTALQASLISARAAGVVAIDGVYNAFKDTDGLRAECEEGRSMGFDGKSLIHPDQIDIANEVFAPTDDEVDLARRQIAAYEEATAKGEGVAVVDGQIVENLHIETAKATLAKADAIARAA